MIGSSQNIALYLNLSQCYLKVGDMWEAEQTATEVLLMRKINEEYCSLRLSIETRIMKKDCIEERKQEYPDGS